MTPQGWVEAIAETQLWRLPANAACHCIQPNGFPLI
jgi:hypothetical protein